MPGCSRSASPRRPDRVTTSSCTQRGGTPAGSAEPPSPSLHALLRRPATLPPGGRLSCAEPPRHPARSSREQCSCRLLRSPRVGRSRGRASPRAHGRTRLTVRSRFPTPVRESPFCVVGSQRSRARSCWPRTVRVVVSGPDIVVRTGPTSSGLSHLSVTLVRTGDDYVRDRPGGWLATHVEDDVSTLASYGLEDLLLVADTATSA